MQRVLRLFVAALAVAGSLLWGPEARLTLCVGDTDACTALHGAADTTPTAPACCDAPCCASRTAPVGPVAATAVVDCSCCLSLPLGGDTDALVEVGTTAERALVAGPPPSAVVLPHPRAHACAALRPACAATAPPLQRVLPLLV